jgi:hypothetical protein
VGSVDTVVWVAGSVMALTSVVVAIKAVRQDGLDLNDLKAIGRRALHMDEKGEPECEAPIRSPVRK